jgi:hypothetical protein
MATKKTTAPAEDAQENVEAEKAAATAAAPAAPTTAAEPEAPTTGPGAPAVVDEWAENIEMIVPRKPKGEEQSYYICINDRRYLVPANGKKQLLPKPVALVLQESLEADAEADDFMDHIPNRSGENPQQHAII